ncbi:T9SS type B sorting domain-containing protein [Flavobacterium sp. RHBU_3]|uniref:T9SS type B sorting domain-containing protein n=1 Tax=Flavobacterium sp. RHBU_3 TaxID=3391184 RepID=UPI003984DE6C
MKKITFIAVLLFVLPLFAQKEANNWFFGWNAGVHFNDDGTVSALAGGQMSTNEGCSSMSDADGNLLFYTDGRTVWDRNHVIMPNGNYMGGTGLFGDPSSTQSAIIIPKKNNPNIYYVFTVDEPHHQNAAVYPDVYTGVYDEPNGQQSIPEADDGFNNGFNYSIIDLSVVGANGSIGDVITRNVPLLTYDPLDTEQIKYRCSEKVTAVKNSADTGYWVVTHFINQFYAFAVDENGVNATPVITTILPTVSTAGYRRNAIGCIKASPTGKYIAIAHQQRGFVAGGTENNGAVYLYDFDDATGQLSNADLIVQDVRPYGIEFSAQEKKLYVSLQDAQSDASVWQYNLESIDIGSSGIQIASGNTSTTLQLGPNGKIYKAVNGQNTLDVINNPENDGADCNYISNGVSLPVGSIAVFGLPPFITSIFSARIVATATCLGQPTQFQLYVNKVFNSVVWDFGDGATSTEEAPQHQYAASGVYSVTATITHNDGTDVVTSSVNVTAPPVANTPPDMVLCGVDDSGQMSFTLGNNSAAVRGGQSAADYTVYYYASQEDADTNHNPLNVNDYTNATNPQTIYVRVVNNSNTSCFATSSFNLIVSEGPSLSSDTYAVCDTDADGSNTNGMYAFTLSEVTTGLGVGSGFTVNWYANGINANAQQNPLPATFSTADTVVYFRLQSVANPACFYVVPITLLVQPLPPIAFNAVLEQCDPQINPDGITQFNLTQADGLFVSPNNNNVVVSYYATAADADAATNPLPAAYTNIVAYSEQIAVRAENTLTGCYRVSQLTLNVNTTQYPLVTLEECDDDGAEDGYAEFNLAAAGYENGVNSVLYYLTENDALLEQNRIASAFTNTVLGGQTVFARIENNNACLAIAPIQLILHSLPPIEATGAGLVCLNTGDYIILESGVAGNYYSYLWSTGQTTNFIQVNMPGTYTVTVTDVDTGCQKVRTFTVTASNIALINTVEVEDLKDNNTITIVATPLGGVQTTYLYSLDSPNGPWQEESYFQNVSGGVHTIYVYDTKGCGIIDKRVGVLDIPNYFTPNGDGTHDEWYIPGLSGQNYTGSMVYIFDRYGKLLVSLTPTQKWDGTYNGAHVPSTDYWYLLNLTDGRTIRGHFSLVR